jgi:hypothetical protein
MKLSVSGLLAATSVAVSVGCAEAHVLQFTPTESIGSAFWPDPTPVIITYTGDGPGLNEFVASEPGIFSPTGTNDGVTSYQDGLNPFPLSTILQDGLLEIPATNFAFLFISGPGLSVDHVQDLNGIGGHLAVPPLPHHRAYGSRTRRFD